MPDAMTLILFLAAAVAASLVWGRALWYFAERSQALRRWVFSLMGFTHRPMTQVRSLVLGGIYWGLGLLAVLSFALGFGLPASRWLLPLRQTAVPGTHAFRVLGWESFLALAVLGAAGEISLTNLLVDLTSRIPGVGGPQRLAEMNEVPWIKGVRQLPRGFAPIAAALGGVVEELFYRGVVQRILTERLMVNAVVAIAIAGLLFYFEQWLQVQTAFQAVVIGCSCVAISAIGGILVALTGSVVPAVIAHASFVLFFVTQGSEAPAGLRQSRTGESRTGMASR